MFPFPVAPPARSATTTMISAGTGTVVGDLTSNGGNAAAFDGTTSQAGAASARSVAGAAKGYIGKDWGSGVSKTITKYIAYAPSDIGFDPNSSHTVTVKLYGSNSAPGSWSGGTVGGTELASDSGVSCAAGTVLTKTSGITTSSAYRYHWITFIPNTGTNEIYVAELQLFEVV